jgi:hypothetical protein
MPQTKHERTSRPHCTIVRTFRAGVEVGCQPTRVDAGSLLVLVIRPDVEWVDVDELIDHVPPTSRIHRSTQRVAING